MYRVLLVDDEVLVREAISENIKWEGFSNPHYFSISFKKMTGKTPIKYL